MRRHRKGRGKSKVLVMEEEEEVEEVEEVEEEEEEEQEEGSELLQKSERLSGHWDLDAFLIDHCPSQKKEQIFLEQK